MTLDERNRWIMERVKDLIGEHCDGYVFICQITDEDSGEVRTPITWDGGFNAALGMANRAHTLMNQEAIDANKPEVPKDEDGDDWKAAR